ncbi:MAG TPA: GlsB/YeaQ/YmgE family stress response membrane protein [Gemmatales bacterium]|nr:GlsB/YeaQ/YmgE family stress response membrane protein [Gemmatales bacterium]HMP16426.1 GlsB/YeaQ/YmgE family stress response membrane protein [Gemmatales bacterium]
MGIFAWIVFGLIAGAMAKYLMPGQQPGGIIVTIILGIVGAVVGGFLGTLLGFGDISGFDLRSMLLAIGGGLVVLFVYSLFTKKAA